MDIMEYCKNPHNKFIMNDSDISREEENRNCWETLEIFMKISDWIITDWSFEWNTSSITTWCSSAVWESLVWQDIKDILKYTEKYVTEDLWIKVTSRRRFASVFALLWTRNTIHKYLNDWIIDDFSDILT